MSKSIVLFLSLLYLSFNVYSQTNRLLTEHPEIIFDEEPSYYLGTEFNYDFNSNSITNNFLNTIFYGGFIDNSIKDEVTPRLRKMNRALFSLNYGMVFRQKLAEGFDWPRYAYLYTKNRAQISIGFTDDLFELSFRGNSQFAGDSAIFSGSNLQYSQFQQIGGGFEHHYPFKGNTLAVSAGISILKGQQYRSFAVGHGSVFTEIDGQYIDLITDYQFKSSREGRSDYRDQNGMGTSLDLLVKYNIGESNNIGGMSDKVLGMELIDLGLINFNNRSYTMTDTLDYTFEGLEILNVFDVDNTLSQQTVDSIINSITPDKEYKNVIYYLPTRIHIFYQQELEQIQTRLAIGGQYRFNTNFAPLLYLRGTYHGLSYLTVSPMLIFGGYGNFNIGLSSTIKLNRYIYLTVSSDYIYGYLSPSSASGQGVFASLSTIF
ncbi:MAG: hypothetical protein IIA45_15435 [Bacteroidetes bacterium]|nr:hypothetical protein [Bacteroidota bacterium]